MPVKRRNSKCEKGEFAAQTSQGTLNVKRTFFVKLYCKIYKTIYRGLTVWLSRSQSSPFGDMFYPTVMEHVNFSWIGNWKDWNQI